jgi:hypothetical protein
MVHGVFRTLQHRNATTVAVYLGLDRSTYTSQTYVSTIIDGMAIVNLWSVYARKDIGDCLSLRPIFHNERVDLLGDISISNI